jgi:hypothetical protein
MGRMSRVIPKVTMLDLNIRRRWVNQHKVYIWKLVKHHLQHRAWARASIHDNIRRLRLSFGSRDLVKRGDFSQQQFALPIV